MIASQRKTHKFIWLGMALAIPVLLFFSVRNLTFTGAIGDASPSEILNAQWGGDTITITLNTSFKNASAVVYGLNKEGKLSRPLGQLLGTGTYTFEASDDIVGIVVIDKIKEKELYKIEF